MDAAVQVKAAVGVPENQFLEGVIAVKGCAVEIKIMHGRNPSGYGGRVIAICAEPLHNHAGKLAGGSLEIKSFACMGEMNPRSRATNILVVDDCRVVKVAPITLKLKGLADQ
ncbi:hypothetical protein BK645_09860 [Pseudomonas protegens]|nr:hypothetical protein BK645_09860 [Pseudomonas protegens]